MNAGSTVISPFGAMPDGRDVEMHTIANARGTEIRFLTLGGIIQSLRVADVDITPGYDTLEGYLADTRYFGALVGRYANRIARGAFTLDGVSYSLPPNDGANHLHGGSRGFSAAVWDVEPFTGRSTSGAVLSLVSPAGDMGYPGTVNVRVTYSLSDDDELRFDYFATTDAPTPINLTQHMYINLAGQDAGDVLGHELMLRASRFTPVDAALIPTGALSDVHGTPFDFTTPHAVGARLAASDAQLAHASGYDHNFAIDEYHAGSLSPAARLRDPVSGRSVEIDTTEPGIQLYSGNHIPGGPAGKNGRDYGRYSSLALETQRFPNSPNEPSFPSTILRPGEEYNSTTVYRFGR